MIFDKWTSIFGFVLPKSGKKQSENGVLFTAEHYTLQMHAGTRYIIPSNQAELQLFIHNIQKLRTTNGGKYRTIPNDANDRFSLDNAIAVASFSRVAEDEIDTDSDKKINKDNLKAVEVLKYAYRFYDVIPFILLCKYSLLEYTPLKLWVSFIAILDFLFSKNEDTSGKILYYLKFRALKMDRTYKVCEYIMEKKGTSFKDAFSTYFPERHHPNNVLARRIWGAS